MNAMMRMLLRVGAALVVLSVAFGFDDGCGRRREGTHDNHHDGPSHPGHHDDPRSDHDGGRHHGHHKRKKPTLVFPTDEGDRAPALQSYALLAARSMRIGERSKIEDGNVGVIAPTAPTGLIRLELDDRADADVEQSIAATSVLLGRDATVGDVYTDRLLITRATHGSLFSFTRLPSLPRPREVSPGSNALVIRKDEPLTLGPGVYGDVRVNTKAMLILSGGRYELRTLDVGNFAHVIVAGRSDVRILEDIRIGKLAELVPQAGLSARDLRIEVAATEPDVECRNHHHRSHGHYHGDHCRCDDDDHGRHGDDDDHYRHGDHDGDDDCQDEVPFHCDSGNSGRDDVDVLVGDCARIQALIATANGTVVLADRVAMTGAIAARTLDVGHDSKVSFEDGFGCQPASCEAFGVGCGVFPDGCGGVINCGACTEPQTSCFGVSLVAAYIRAEDPADDVFSDGSAAVGADIQFVIPSEIPVTQGAATDEGVVTLAFMSAEQTADQCYYYATDSLRYVFDSCDSGTLPGSLRDASLFALRVDDAGPPMSATTISLRLDAQPCNCIATTCALLDATCGVRTDGCGGLVNCGGCVDPLTCGGDPAATNECGCLPRTCDADACGDQDDGCGGTITCGACMSPDSCGGGGFAGQCGCTSLTCAEAALARALTPCAPLRPTLAACEAELALQDYSACESIQEMLADCRATPPLAGCDGLQSMLDSCRASAPPLYPPTHCDSQRSALNSCIGLHEPEAARVDCGLLSDGCGGFADCGACDGVETCGGGGEANVCDCVPKTAADYPGCCGTLTDGCGGYVSCNGCPSGRTCDALAGRCSIPQTFSSTDACATGATISVDPNDISTGQTFGAVCNGAYPPGSALDSTLGDVVTAGNAVDFGAGGLSTYHFETCATLCVPYDPSIVAANSPATEDDLQLYRVSESAVGKILFPITPQTIDKANHRVCGCTEHLSTYVVALRNFCDAPVTSPAIDVVGRAQQPTNYWSVNRSNDVRFAPVLFAPPQVTIDLGANPPAGAFEGCLGVLLFHGVGGGLDYVCQYDTAIREHEACYYPFNSHIARCKNLSVDPVAELRDCYRVRYTGGAPPPDLGPFAMSVGTVGGVAAWIDPRTPAPPHYADTFNLNVWFVASFADQQVPDVPGITARTSVKSHPLTCVTAGVAFEGLSACGDMPNGCGGTLHCSPPCPGPGCPCDGGLCCGGQVGCTAHTIANVCGCPDGSPHCVPFAEYCGAEIGANLIDTSNPCKQLEECTPATPPATVSTIRYRELTGGVLCPGGNENKCDGVGRCFSGRCIAGPAPLVQDGDDCTDDLCDPNTGQVSHPANGRCDAGGCPIAGQYPLLSGDLNTKVDAEVQIKVNALKASLHASCPDCDPVLWSAP